MSSFGIIAIAPPSFEQRASFECKSEDVEFRISDAAIALAASQCGETGIVDVEYTDLTKTTNLETLEKALLLARSEGGTKYGVKASAAQINALKPVLVKLTEGNKTSASAERPLVILVADSGDAGLKKAVKTVQSTGWQVFVECLSADEAKRAEAANADGIIAKGHEAGGRVGEQTAFVLVQECVKAVKLPIFAEGGIGLHTAAACRAAGAHGVVLTSQLLLTRESRLPFEVKQKIAGMDGTETALLTGAEGQNYRVVVRAGHEIMSATKEAITKNDILKFAYAEQTTDRVWLIGQDACFADRLAIRFVSTAGVLQAVRESVNEHLSLAKSSQALAEGAPLAVSHGTKYPLVQGAMTRVSDTADFAFEVANGGGLPFLALALMRKGEVDALVSKTHEKLGKLPWGAGLLGFVPNELRQEQLEVITKYKPPFALIAGGRPDQAKQLEDLGIKTYLHVPSPLLLESFIEMGSRRFIFEGKECGGHVGPRSSFILWETMIEVLLRSIGNDANKYHILFAGGVHDAVSSAMVSAMAAPLVAKGVKVGGLMGTAYLFTEEAVKSGAIVKPFQKAAIECNQTVLLETGPGHAIRCIDSPYKKAFDNKREELTAQKKSRDEIREELELMNLGRLRIASKGVNRNQNAGKDAIIADLKTDHGANAQSKDLVAVSENDQWQDGMYMIGQIASMHEKVTTIEELHKDVCVEGSKLLESIQTVPVVESVRTERDRRYEQRSIKPSEAVAIVGMSCLFPKANDLETYWQNILNKVDAIEEVPLEQWDWREFYDKDPLAPDKIYSKWGGFLKDIEFDPTIYGIPPSSLKSIDPMQVLLLEVTRAALADAGYTDRSFPRQKTSVVLANAGHGPITAFYSLRSMLGWKLADLPEDIKQHIASKLPEWSEDSFPGYLGNVTAGRVANRFDLGGVNFSIDAACGSSLAALHVSMAELRNYNSDVVFLCASDTHNQPGDYLSFSKTHAFSQSGHCRTFDAAADGIVISEGMAMLVLKRLSDAERDGDRIYAVVRGVGGSSDGRDLSLTAPRPAGQMLAISRAYEDAGITPSTVSLVETHGTGTVAGDKAEIGALKQVFDAAGAPKRSCAVGSVKTMIGHTKAAAGLASMIKVAKALHHKVLPPSIGVTVPNPSCDFENSPFYINSESRPWVNTLTTVDGADQPRRAGVSAFGFGGTNFHAVLEEYVPKVQVEQEPPATEWPAELFVLKGASRADLFKPLSWLTEQTKKATAQQPVTVSLKDLAYQLHLKNQDKAGNPAKDQAKAADNLVLTVVATSFEDLAEKLSRAKSDLLDNTKKQIKDPRGIYFVEPSGEAKEEAKVAFVFPGQGSQQVDMLKDVASIFPEVRKTLESASAVLKERLEKPLSSYIYPPPAFTDEEKTAQHAQLTDTRIAQPAIGAADLAMLRLLQSFNVSPDMVAGHSYGEYVALCAAKSLSEADLIKISETRGRILSEKKGAAPGTMAAVSSDAAAIKKIMDKLSGVTLANINSPTQCVISGERSSIDNAVSVCKENGLAAKVIPVSQAFHSVHMGHAKEPLKQELDKLDIQVPQIPVYSNADAQVYPSEPAQIAKKLSEHIVAPVDFVHEIENMYRDGARIFVECGPNAVLTALITSILDQQKANDYVALAVDRSGRNGVVQLLHALAQLAANGVQVNTSVLYRGRLKQTALSLEAQRSNAAANGKKRLMYRVNGMKIERINPNGASAGSTANENKTTAKVTTAAVSKSPATTSSTTSTATKTIQQFSPTNPAAGNHQPANGKKDHGESKVPFDTKSTPPAASFNQAPNQNGHQLPESVALPDGTFAASGSNGGTFVSPQIQGYQPNFSGVPVVNPSFPQQLGHMNTGWIGAPMMPQAGMQGVEQMMMHYQQMMLQMTNTFMASQQQVMLNYLQAKAGQVMPVRPAFPGQPMQQFPAPQAQTWPQMPVANSFQQQMQQPLPFQQTPMAPVAQAVSPFQQIAQTAPQTQAVIATTKVEPAAEKSSFDNGNGNGNGNGHVHEAEAKAVVEAATTEIYDAEALVTALLDIVSERTGYPPDMLDPTLDLEADLGIDSIKRVEILNSFRKILPAAKQAQLESGIEELAGTKTLEGIIAWIRKEPVATESGAAVKQPADLNVKIDGQAVNYDIEGKLEDGHNGNGNGHGSNGNGHNGNGHGNGHNGNGKSQTSAANAHGSNGSGKSTLASLDDLVSPAEKKTVKSEMKRALVKVVDLPALQSEPSFSGTWLVTCDDVKLAESIKKQWEASGATCVIIEHSKQESNLADHKASVNLLDFEEVERQIGIIRQEHGPISGFVHCVGANSNKSETLGSKSLFVVAKALDAEISAAAGTNGGAVVISRMGGVFKSSLAAVTENDLYTQAGSVGLLKCLAKEWPGVTCKAIDFARNLTSEQIARAAAEEFCAADTRTEVGRGAELQRFGLDVAYAPLQETENAIKLNQDSVVLVTGGARGITAELATELAQRFQPTLILAGRAEEPAGEEAPHTAGLTSAKDLKAAIMTHMREQKEAVSIAVVEQTYVKLLRDREIRGSIAKLRAHGSQVHYRSVDVKNDQQFAALIDDIYSQFGKINGVINGAGVIEDGFLKQKSLASFERVFDTKVNSAITLAQKLRFDEQLQFVFLFSSVVGRTGNAGQTDYVSANEVINKLATELNQKSGARVASLMWGPWKGGMANPELESIFARYGWAMIAPEEGRKAFIQELASGSKSDAEVLLVAELAKDGDSPVGTGPRLQGVEAQRLNSGEHEFHLTLNPAQDVYLKDHTFDGVPVMPMAFALELMAEAVQSVYTDWACARVINLDIPSGIVFDTSSKQVTLSVVEQSRNEATLLIESSLSVSYPRKRTNFKATFELVKKSEPLSKKAALSQLPDVIPTQVAGMDELKDLSEADGSVPTVEQIYSEYLFHGPLFQHITAVEAVGAEGIVGRLTPSQPVKCIPSSKNSEWMIDPVLLDSAMQLAGVWVRKYLDITTLPTGFRKLHLVKPLTEQNYLVRAFMDSQITSTNLACHVAVYEESGELVLLLEGLGGVGSKSLNRLASPAGSTGSGR